MELWQKILLAAIFIFMIFRLSPGIKASMEQSKNAEDKHWGTLLVLVLVLIAFIMFLISSVQ